MSSLSAVMFPFRCRDDDWQQCGFYSVVRVGGCSSFDLAGIRFRDAASKE